jgi:predicted secreted protein
MKKILTLVLIGMMLISSFSFADTTATPVLISAPLFTVEQDGDQFTIIFEENGSTGYVWTYTINKEDHVKYLMDEVVASESGMVGAPGLHKFTFEVLDEGVSTITFKHARPFDESDASEINILVYKSGDKVFVEEDGIVTIQEPTLYTEMAVTFNGEPIALDVKPQEIDGVMMIPLAETLRAMGYTVTWNQDTFSVEISRNAQWTSIKIGENAYFKNRMAARPLSKEPVIVDGRTLVPAEFFNQILDLGMTIENGSFDFNEYMMGQYQGYVKEIETTDHGQSIHIVYSMDNEMTDVIIHTSNDTIYQKEVVEGDFINVITSMATTMSIPPQTSAYIIY